MENPCASCPQPKVRLVGSSDDRCIAKLHVSCRDQVNFLFKLSELLVAQSIDVEHAEIATEDGMLNNVITLRASRAVGFANAGVWCAELERVIERGGDCRIEEEPLSSISRRLAVNPDLMSVTSFQEVMDKRRRSSSFSRDVSGLMESTLYRLELQGINQMGLLAFVLLVLSRSGFSVQRASISTNEGHVFDTFDLVTESRSAERILRSYLALPQATPPCSLPLWELSADPRKVSGQLRVLENKRVDAGPATLTYSQGDVYEGAVDVDTPGAKRRHGWGLYTYASSHAKYKQYRGQWYADEKSGFGILYFRDGGAYAGQWRNNRRHGLGVMFSTKGDDFTASMPSYRYEGEWANDEPDGLGMEVTRNSLYCGKFQRGERFSTGVEIRSDCSGIKGCNVLDGCAWKPLASFMDEGISSSAKPKAHPFQALAGAYQAADAVALSSLTFHAGASRNSVRPSLASLAFPESGTDDAAQQTIEEEPLLQAMTFNAASRPSARPSLASLAFPEFGVGNIAQQTIPESNEAEADEETRADEQAQRKIPHGRTWSRAPASGFDADITGQDACAATTDTPMSRPSHAEKPMESSAQGSMPFGRSSKSPILWDQEDLAIFFSHLGLGEEPVERILQRRVKGPSRMLELPDDELCDEFGLTTALQRLVARGALQKLLEADRWQNSARGKSYQDVLEDSTLAASIVPFSSLKLGSCISEGGFGKIYKGILACSDRDGLPQSRRVAVKEMKGDKKVRIYELLKEARVMASLRHPNICEFIGICADDTPFGKRFLISQLLDCSLYDLLHQQHCIAWQGSVTILLICRLAKGICSGLAYLHQRSMVHADLKSSNILIDCEAMTPKICDFGHLAVRTVPLPHDRLCTPHYASPEALRGEGLTPAADIYSVGVLLWEMLVRQIPHKEQACGKPLTFSQVMVAVGWAGLLPDMNLLPEELPQRLRRLLFKCLAFDAGARPTAQRLRRELAKIPREATADACSALTAFLDDE
eukprot:TRINITY_DN995_c0_g1_i2.p1 TRINITY_DN995_c0_g1~~TRINITY_DN995_c0_g1_i2.p1  ORF type:complete len:993 (+),score=167.13 TRINITY_DN995_c0_g1_i2:197-3175(+)